MSEPVYRLPPDEDSERITINMGPSHPATHGVLRLVLELDGEVVKSCKPDLGYLHRGFEKIAENKTWQQFMTWTDRMDYLAPISNNTAYALAVEKLLGIEVPERCKDLRVILCEMARISAHLLWLGTHALDLGAMTVFFYTFQQREYLYDLFEKLTGARLTTSTIRIGGMARDASAEWLAEVGEWNEKVVKIYDECEGLLTRNRIWVDRTRDIGVMSAEEAIAMSLSGPVLRASGVEWDLRRAQPYLSYPDYDFEIPVGTVGDTYDRYLVRIEEMRQSSRIIRQALKKIPDGPINADAPKVVLPPKEKVLTSMEDLIHHFIILTEGIQPPKGEVYHAIEAPKGELGFYIVSDGGPAAYRCRIRAGAFVNLQSVEKMALGHMVADVVAIIGSLDPVMGEVDR
ncbi:MAG: NADH dehydrogenase (quinone) subunit D [Acidobacteriota bacterium]|nr:NADH dehydrogenase (quinone) subunit D [Acidobacteriota bacterium]MDQ7087634.1 NADH dehydrogenase (quinone) subunit D [Acidobacteriota bacterium]